MNLSHTISNRESLNGPGPHKVDVFAEAVCPMNKDNRRVDGNNATVITWEGQMLSL